MVIITISRQFGSGGRELGRKLAAALGFDYYDKEIIAAIAENMSMDVDYVGGALDNAGLPSFTPTLGNSFAFYTTSPQTSLMLEERKVLEEIAKKGKDCVIVGRNADIILREYNPISLFVCADMESRVRRCVANAPEGEDLTAKQLEKKIRQIDKSRTLSRSMLTSAKWGRADAYNLVVNTAGWDREKLTKAVAEYVRAYINRA